jgi:hypothetical protein
MLAQTEDGSHGHHAPDEVPDELEQYVSGRDGARANGGVKYLDSNQVAGNSG